MDTYLLRDQDDRVDGDGLTWWVYIDPSTSGKAYVGAFPLEPAQVRGWWRLTCPFNPDTDTIEVESYARRVLTGYRRKRVVEGFPETMTVAEYESRTEDEDADEGTDGELVAVLYESVYEDGAVTRTALPSDWTILDGAAPPNDGLLWQATLPGALRNRAEYAHLFPGHLLNYREAVAMAINTIDGAKAYAREGRPHVSVFLNVQLPRLEPIEWLKPPNYEGMSAASKRRARDRLAQTYETITRTLEVPVPHSVPGANRAAATVEWNEGKERYLAYVRAIVGKICPKCGGRGFLEGELGEDGHEHA